MAPATTDEPGKLDNKIDFSLARPFGLYLLCVSAESRGITSLIGTEALPLLPLDVDEGTTTEGKLGEGDDTTVRLTPSTNNGIDLEIAVLLSLFRLSSTLHSGVITSLIGDASAPDDNLLLPH